MPTTEALPAIRRIDTDRDDLCALEVVGHLSRADLENAYGLLEAAYLRHDKIDLLLRITLYEGFDWAVAFDRTTIRGEAQALRHIRRYAVVGGPVWMRTVIGIFGPLTSVKTRCFDAGDEAAGWEWIGGKPVDSG